MMEEVEDTRDAGADSAAAPAAEASAGTVRGYDKRVVYGVAAAVMIVFITFSFFGGSSGGSSAVPPAVTAPSYDSGPLVADPPYAATPVLRDSARPFSGAAPPIPPPSSAVVGGADGRPYETVGAGAPGSTGSPSGSAAGAESDDGRASGDGGAAQREVDPRLAAWRAVRDTPPATAWGTADSPVSALSGGGAPVFDPAETTPGEQPAERDTAAALTRAEPDSAATRPAATAGPVVVVPALTRIEAALVTAVNSDLPGDVVARVTRDVLGAEGRIAIPAGAVLLGRQSDQVALGQRRLMIVWTSLQLPDLTNVPLPGLASGDAAGAAGLAGRVDSHAAGAFGRALLLSAIGAGFQLSQPQTADGSTPSAGRAAAGAVGQQLAELSSELLRRDVSVRPTIRLEQGTPVSVLVAADLRVPARSWARTGRSGR